MKNLKLILSLAIAVVGLSGLAGCFQDPNEEDLCTNTCQYAYDGECDDGGPGSITSLCPCATDCADCGERSELDCDGGSSSSSSGSSSSSSSGGGYTQNDAVGTWFGNAPNSNHWYLYLCGNGLFVFKEYNPVGDLQFDHTGTWSISGSTLSLSGSNSWTFQILDITTAGAGAMTLSSSGSQVILENQLGQDPCTTTGSSSSSSSGGSSSSSSSGGGPSFGTVSDNDGNTYQTVVIGSQTWMAENMKTTKTRNGQSIPSGFTHYTSPMYPSADEVLAMTWKDNNQAFEDDWGGLYNFYTAERICPSGWHLPTKQDWETLKSYVSSDATKLQKVGSWPSNSTNETGFSAVPTGAASNNSGSLDFWYNGSNTTWWSDYIDYSSMDGYGFSGYDSNGFTTYNTPVYNPTSFQLNGVQASLGEAYGGRPCRCVKD